MGRVAPTVLLSESHRASGAPARETAGIQMDQVHVPFLIALSLLVTSVLTAAAHVSSCSA